MSRLFAAVLLFLSMPLSAAEDRYLLPVYVDVPGAHGAMFISELRLLNTGSSDIAIRGLEFQCAILCPPSQREFVASPGSTYTNLQKSGLPGVIITTTAGADVRMNLRVRDTSRDQLSAGTEVPVVREADLRRGMVVLLGVPPEGSQFRNRLRVYSFAPGQARVLFIRESDNANLHEVMLTLRAPDAVAPAEAEFYPAFGETTDFPVAASSIRVQVEHVTGLDGLWGFVSTTNNETQEITLITQQP
jgi:hypothetical protein